jgi:hypothetical protein
MKKETLNKIVKFLDLTENVVKQVKEIIEEYYPEKNTDTETEQSKNSEEKTENNIFKVRIGTEHFYYDRAYKILTATAEWLIKYGGIKKEDCPIYVGEKNNVLLIDKSKDNFRSPKKLSNGLWIKTNFSTKDCIRRAKELLKKCGYSKEVLEVRKT